MCPNLEVEKFILCKILFVVPDSLNFDISWILGPVASPGHVTSNEVQDGSDTCMSILAYLALC